MNVRVILGLGLLTVVTLSVVHAAPPTGTYDGAGVIVTGFQANANAVPGVEAGVQLTLVDNGAVLCDDTNGDGAPDSGRGGMCLRFQDLVGDSVYVHDATVPDSALAFQVCIDNNGDGLCGGTAAGGSCVDQIQFSHRTSDGTNANPLLMDHAGFAPGCGAGAFPGYVVMVCAGLHFTSFGTNAQAHNHQATSGTVSNVVGGTNVFGDFCGAPTAVKAYLVV